MQNRIMKIFLRAAAGLVAACVALAGFGLVEFKQPEDSPVIGPEQEPALEAVELFRNYIAPSNGLDIKASAADGSSCVAPGTEFLLSLAEPLEEKYIKQWLKTEPEFDYSLKKTGALEYRLTPKQEFEKNTLVTLSFDPLQTDNGMSARAGNSWAFQTQKGFALERNFPMDQGTGVPVNSVIELAFTGEVKLADLKKYVAVSPKLGGGDWRETGLNTYAFLPTGSGMQKDTVYEVRVKRELSDSLGGETLGKDLVFKFRTEEEETNFWSSAGYENNAFMPSEKPVFTLSFHPENESAKIPTQVFRFGTLEAYAGAVSDSLNYDYWTGKEKPELDTAPLEKVFDGKLEIMGDTGGGLAVLPKALPAGFYAARFTTNGRALTCLFQVTNLSAYAMGGGGDSLFWVNDLATSKPVAGADISVLGGKSAGKTGQDGALALKSGEGGKYTAYLVQSGGDRLLMMLYTGERGEGFSNLDYWKYVYCDRQLYKPTDTVKFFGVAAPKQAGTKEIANVTAVVGESYWNESPSSEIRAQAAVKNGVYEGELQLPELPPGWYALSVYAGEERLGSTYFEVKLYRKPAYSLSVSVDKPILWPGEQATVTAATAYFDGTPVAQLELRMDGETVRTDGFGRASVRVDADPDDDRLVSSEGVGVEAELPEIGQVYEHTYVQTVNSDVEVRAAAKRGKEGSALELQAFSVDFTGLDYIEWYDESEALKDFGGSLSLDLSWTRITYTERKIPTGEKRYDPYTKTYTEYYYYEYDKHEKREGGKTVTVKGKDPQSFALPLKADGEYRIDIAGKDTKGRTFRRSTYVYEGGGRFNYDYGKAVYVRPNNGKARYAIGDGVSLSLYENYDAGEPIKMAEQGAVLFIRASDKFLDYTVSQDNLLEFTFDGKVLPNINVHGVLFDGREYVERYYPYSAMIDAESRALHLQVTPDKESYRPGDTAKLSVKLTGPDGKPTKGTVNLNMVDEALLAMREQYADIADLFGDTYDFYPATSISHILVRNTGGGEKGDGEGDGGRSDFRDTALFKTIEAGADGLADVEVKLPDNITSWRLFWQAFRGGDSSRPGEVMAGSGRANLIVTLPFFIDLRLCDTFLTGDKPTLGIRNAGTALKDGQVKYTVEIPSLGFSRSADAPLSKWYEMPLPELKAGTYDISVAGEYNGLKDKITRKFTVAEGIADHIGKKTAALSEGLKLDISAKGTARLVFADKRKAQVMRALWELLGTGVIRAEQRIARQAAQEALAGLSPDGRGWYGVDDTGKIAEYQRENGSVAPFTYGDVSDREVLETTAWACAVNSEYFSKPALASYLSRYLDSKNDEEAALALMGLAALKEPVMQRINHLLGKELEPQARIYLALAQVFIGNGSAAKSLAQGVISDFCATERNGELMLVDGGSYVDTANLAVAAVLLDLPEGGPLYQYVLDALEEVSAENPCPLQRVLILAHKAKSVNPECASFKYTLGGETRRVKLFLCHSLLLRTEQLRQIKFSDISDEIEVTASYTAAGFPAGKDGALSVSQKYADVDMAQTGTATGEISYSIGEDAPEGYYDIVHVLPAGLEFSGLVWSPNQYVWVSQVKGQQVTFTVHTRWSAASDTFRFTARPVMTGSFRSEGTYITDTAHPERVNSAPGGVVTIK